MPSDSAVPAAKIGSRTTRRRWIVCIPVTTDELDLLTATFPSVLRNTSAETPILLLAVGGDLTALRGASPESARIEMAQAKDSDDPWQAALRELPSVYARHDLLLLRPGVEVPPGWDIRLALAMDRQPAVAATVPLCDSASFIALLEPKKPSQINLARIDHLLLAHSPRREHEIPALFSGCCYLRRAALRVLEPDMAAQPPLSTGEWCRWLAQAFRERGWGAVGCDHLYVLDHAPDRRRREMSAIEALADVRLIERAHPLLGLRLAVRDLLDQGGSAPTETPVRPPVQMHVAHSWGGGLDYWIRQYCEGDRARDNLVLRSIGTWGAFGQRIALYRSANMDQPLRYWDLGFPIRATATAHLQYQMILREIVAEFHVEAILISSLVGHSLDALATGLPTVIVAHDYYPFCPAVVIYFGGVCDRCEQERLQECFDRNEQNRFFRNANGAEWLSLRRRFVRLARAESVRFVVPSPAVAHHWQTLVPELRDKPFAVIPHGLDFAPPRLPAPPARQKLRVVVLGSLAPQKGRALLEQVWPLIAEHTELYLVGCDEDGEIFRDRPGITIIPRFRHDELANQMAAIGPDVGLLLSVWPETFSYTLSELWLLGIPVVAIDLGSFADRIQDGVSGFLCSPRPEAVADRLLAIAIDRVCLTPLRDWMAHFHHRSVAEMIADYHALIPLPAFSAARYFAPAAISPAVPAMPRALHVDARMSFSQVLLEFGEYAGQKLATTPRLRPWQKRGLTALLRLSLRGAFRLAQSRVRPE